MQIIWFILSSYPQPATDYTQFVVLDHESKSRYLIFSTLELDHSSVGGYWRSINNRVRIITILRW